jgi:hypothetical protein
LFFKSPSASISASVIDGRLIESQVNEEGSTSVASGAVTAPTAAVTAAAASTAYFTVTAVVIMVAD